MRGGERDTHLCTVVPQWHVQLRGVRAYLVSLEAAGGTPEQPMVDKVARQQQLVTDVTEECLELQPY
jgi:hypothetical protein